MNHSIPENNYLKNIVNHVQSNNHMTKMANEGKLRCEARSIDNKHDSLENNNRYNSTK